MSKNDRVPAALARYGLPTLDQYMADNEPDYVFDRILDAWTGRPFVIGLLGFAGLMVVLMIVAAVTA